MWSIQCYTDWNPDGAVVLLKVNLRKNKIHQDLQRNKNEMNIEEIILSIRQLKQFVNTLKQNQNIPDLKNNVDNN